MALSVRPISNTSPACQLVLDKTLPPQPNPNPTPLQPQNIETCYAFQNEVKNCKTQEF
jgi:hypothetical protein